MTINPSKLQDVHEEDNNDHEDNDNDNDNNGHNDNDHNKTTKKRRRIVVRQHLLKVYLPLNWSRTQIEGLTSVHEFHLWQLNANKIIVTLHVSCSRGKSQSEYEKLRDEITDFFHNEGIHSITVQPEFVDPEVVLSNVLSFESSCVVGK